MMDAVNATPQDIFRRPLVLALHNAGGAMCTDDIRRTLRSYKWPHAAHIDTEFVSSGQERWWNKVCWERNKLKDKGYIRRNSERGIWELSEKGRVLAEWYLENPPLSLNDF